MNWSDPRNISGRALICYDDISRGATLTASTQAADAPPANAFDDLSYDFWQAAGAGTHNLTIANAAAATVDYLALANHNLAGGSVRLQGSNDGSTFADLIPGTSKLVVSNAPLLVLLPRAVAYSTFRIVATQADEAPRIAVAKLGQRMRLQRGVHGGYTPAPYARRVDFSTTESEGGQFVGRTVTRVNNEIAITLDNVTQDWVRSVWAPFQLDSETRPFFFVADAVKHPTEVFFGYRTAPAEPTIDRGQFMTVNLQARGLA